MPICSILCVIAPVFCAKTASLYFLSKFSPLVYHDNKALPRELWLLESKLGQVLEASLAVDPFDKGFRVSESTRARWLTRITWPSVGGTADLKICPSVGG
jgi:hypothetical protein